MSPDTSIMPPPFHWPEGKRAAISLTFDDARLSQVDRGLPILDAHGVQATFYVSPSNLEKRLDGWRAAVAKGHEIGNHTLSHPCSGNFAFARRNALEDYTLERMQAELLGANDAVERLLGVAPITFAYPCGQAYVGRGANVCSYVPLVARHFVVGRGAFNERHNDPAFCDLAQVFGMDADGKTFQELRKLIDAAVAEAGWLVLFGHEIGSSGYQTVVAEALNALCRYAQDPANGLWLDTVAAIGGYVEYQREPRKPTPES